MKLEKMSIEKYAKALNPSRGHTSTLAQFNKKGELCDMNGHPIIANVQQAKYVLAEIKKRKGGEK